MNATNPQVIDLSHHNTVLSLHDAAASGVVGVIHKATEGTHYVDPNAKQRFALTRDAGMCWGIYHFLRAGNIDQQADWFLSQKNLRDEKTLIALDFEVAGVSADDLLMFLIRIEGVTGQKPVLYSGSFLKALKGQEKLSGYRLWLAQYGPKVILPKGFDDYFLWQYSDSGEVPGIKGTCDVSTSRLTNAELKQNWISQTVPADSTPEPADNPVIPTSEPDNAQKPAPAPAIAIAALGTDTTPKGDPPDAAPVQVSKSGPLAKWLFSGGGLGALGTAIWGFVQGNLNAVAVGLICLTVLILAIIFRGAITDAIRMQSAADPDKRNVS